MKENPFNRRTVSNLRNGLGAVKHAEVMKRRAQQVLGGKLVELDPSVYDVKIPKPLKPDSFTDIDSILKNDKPRKKGNWDRHK